MDKQSAPPIPTPIPTFSSFEESLPNLIEHISLSNKKIQSSCAQQQCIKGSQQKKVTKTKNIEKQHKLRRNYKWKILPHKKQNYKKQVQKLQTKIEQLQNQIKKLKNTMECCLQCRYFANYKQQSLGLESLMPTYEQQIKNITNTLNDSRGSINSIEFQNVDFQSPRVITKEMDDKCWVYLGMLMIAMGSKNLEVDGTINVFRVLKQSVDTLRRQFQKSSPTISMDFYLTQQQMKQTPCMDDVGFDPFTEQISCEMGLSLEGIRVESVQQFQLIYDDKLSYNVKYEALLRTMEYLRQNSWVVF